MCGGTGGCMVALVVAWWQWWLHGGSGKGMCGGTGGCMSGTGKVMCGGTGGGLVAL